MRQASGRRKKTVPIILITAFFAHRKAVIEKIDPDMPFLQQGDRHPEQNDDGKQMPFHLLHPHGTVAEKIAHDDIEKDIQGHQEKDNGQHPSQKAADLAEKNVQFSVA